MARIHGLVRDIASVPIGDHDKASVVANIEVARRGLIPPIPRLVRGDDAARIQKFIRQKLNPEIARVMRAPFGTLYAETYRRAEAAGNAGRLAALARLSRRIDWNYAGDVHGYAAANANVCSPLIKPDARFIPNGRDLSHVRLKDLAFN
jgi:hypothetical protein